MQKVIHELKHSNIFFDSNKEILLDFVDLAYKAAGCKINNLNFVNNIDEIFMCYHSIEGFPFVAREMLAVLEENKSVLDAINALRKCSKQVGLPSNDQEYINKLVQNVLVDFIEKRKRNTNMSVDTFMDITKNSGENIYSVIDGADGSNCECTSWDELENVHLVGKTIVSCQVQDYFHTIQYMIVARDHNGKEYSYSITIV